MRRATPLLLLFMIGCGGSPSLSGQQLGTGTLGSPAARASFGQSVAILGEQVAIGAPAEDGGARNAGRVHVFNRSDGSLVRTLKSPAPAAAGRFGTAIAADGGVILAGEPGRGRAHLIDAAGNLVATLAGPGDFGRAVALGGGYACVGAPSRGEVSVFDAATGSLVRVLARPGALGTALAIVDGRLLAGAPSAGRAYVFGLPGGDELLALAGPRDFGAAVASGGGSWLVAAPDAGRVFLYDGAGTLVRTFFEPGFADSFGTGVAYDIDHVIVGGAAGGVPSLFLFDPATGVLARTIQSTSPNEGLSLTAFSGVALVGLFPTGTSPNPGVAQTFSCDSGGLLQTFESPGDVPQGGLGASILLLEDGRTAVGAPGEGTGGLVHIFDEDGTLSLTIASPTPQSIGGFGSSLASPGQAICIGAPGETGGGRVHMFDATDGSFIRTFVPSVSATEFGAAISIDGDTLYVGSPGDVVFNGQTTVPMAGRVHPFTISTGLAGTPIASPLPAASGRFGAAVSAFDGDFVVGAPGETSGQGAAYRFSGGSTTPSVTLGGPAQNAARFGSAVALTLDDIWVGAPDEDVVIGQQVTQIAAGAVHVYERSKGGFQATLLSSQLALPQARFGASLSRGSQWMAIGAPGEAASITQSPPGGVVHQYEVATRIRVRKFTSPVQGTAAGGFGASVAINSSRLVVGAPLEDRGAAAPNAGFAYLFDLDAVASLRSPQPQDAGLFGFDVAMLDDDAVVIGAPFEGPGTVHLIDPAGGQPLTIPAPDQQGSQFGWAVAILNADFIVTAPGANGGAGEAYLFDAGGNLLQSFQSPDGATIGFGDDIAAVGGNILVGSPGEVVDDVSNVGRAYLFSPDGTLLQTFDSPNGEGDGEFGASVANFGGDVLIGAPGEDASAGRAYLFDPNGTLIRTFNGSTVGGGRFGAGVGAVDSGTLAGSILEVAVGAPETTAGGTVTTFDQFTGAVTGSIDNPEGFQGKSVGFGEVFAEVGGTFAVGSPFGGFGRGRVYFYVDGEVIGFVESPNAQIGGEFGAAIEGFGGSLFVGAPTEDVNPVAAGRAYIMGIPTQQGPQPDATFVSPSPTPNGGFGWSVSFAGGVPVVSAPFEDEGIVYLFDPVTLVPDTALQAANPVPGAQFGFAVAANFLQITVGEPQGASGAGRAYLFDATTRLLSLTFNSSNPEQGGLFGGSVAVTGANAVVGAIGEDAQGVPNSGRAYYFDCLAETVLQVFESPNPVANGQFGCAVATAGFDVYVGACTEGAGNVYGFFGLTGASLGTFPHPDPQTGALFGVSLAMFGTDILVGAPNQTVGTQQVVGAGAAYLIDTATGNTLLTLTKPVPSANDGFGTSVAVFGGSIFVGAPGANKGAGEVWEFDASTGDVIASYTSPNPEGGGAFGASLAAISQNFLVGAPFEDGGDADAGVAYLNPPAAQ